MNLKEWLFMQRLSITVFAGLLKVDRTYVHRWFTGKKIPSDEVMERIRTLTMGNIDSKEDLKDEKQKSR